jgi:periplasmic mercuric ion binding protein
LLHLGREQDGLRGLPSIVKDGLEAVPGVAKVAMSFKDKTATVSYDDAKADLNQSTSATTKAGYPSSPES